MPVSRPLPVVSAGVSELRMNGADGIFRLFYYLASPKGVLVFHAFVKRPGDASP
jgi:phage-related protein